jgi:hypothetical protein
MSNQKSKKCQGRGGRKGTQGVKVPPQPRVVAPKEKIERVPLLHYGCTMVEFMTFEIYLIAFVESGGFPLDGHCLIRDYYTNVTPITNERIDDQMMS